MQLDEMHELRGRFRPSAIQVLFVGESPPRSGQFFYANDTILHKATKDAFSRSYKRIFTGVDDFITFFENKGCYLDDLCSRQVNGLKQSQRRYEREQGVPGLAQRIELFRPMVVLSLMKGITPYVLRAISQTSLRSINFHSLPFPYWVHRQVYVAELERLIDFYRALGILP